MIIYLKHPVHGTKVAVLEMEAEADEQNGWLRYTLDQTEPDFQEGNMPEIELSQIKKRGRPPKNA